MVARGIDDTVTVEVDTVTLEVCNFSDGSLVAKGAVCDENVA